MKKFDLERLTIGPIEAMGENVSQSSTDMNIYWMDENPALVGRSLQRILMSHPPDEWDIRIKEAFMPGMTYTIVCKRKDASQ